MSMFCGHQLLFTNIETTAKFNFTDAFSGGALNADVLYDLSVLDSNGTQVFEKKGLTAKNSEDTQTIKFPAPGTVPISFNHHRPSVSA